MRMMLRVQIPVETGNVQIKNGKLPEALKKTMEKLKPEAAYFFPDGGERAFLMVFDMKENWQMPTIVEPLFEEIDAAVELFPVMNADDLMKGLAQIGK